MRRKKLPEPPQGIRLVRPDGTMVPIEVVYVGKDKAGCDEWQMVCPYAFDPGSDRLQIDMMPAHSAVTFALVSDGPPTGFRAEGRPS